MGDFQPPPSLNLTTAMSVDIVDVEQAERILMPSPTPTPSPTIFQSPTSTHLQLPPSFQRGMRSSGSSISSFNGSPTDNKSEDFHGSLGLGMKPWITGNLFHETTEKLEEPDSNPWKIIYKLRNEHDKGMCAAWREEIDKLIIFAGLFSAVVVPFLAISYPMLQPDAAGTQNQMYIGLYTIWNATYTAQLNGGMLELPAPPTPAPATVYHPPPSVLRVNAVWFLSLTLSLDVVLVGTVCLQWIREYERDTRRGPKEGFAVRQMRFDGFHFWKVPFIISSLPIVLQSSLLLFFWGLLEFLWTLNHLITQINVIVIASIFFFIFATISLPTFQCTFSNHEQMRSQNQCPYKSPQARIFALSIFSIVIPIIKLLQMIKGRKFLKTKLAFLVRFTKGRDWVPFDNAWHKLRLIRNPGPGAQEFDSHDLPHGLAWLATTYAHKTESLKTLHYFMRNLHPSTSLATLKRLDIPHVMKFQPEWSTIDIPRYNDILADIYSAFLLHHQVGCNQLRAFPLLHRRMELLVRIANYRLGLPEQEDVAFIKSFIDDCLSNELDCALNPFTPDHDYSTLSREFKQQLLMTFSGYLNLGVGILNPVMWSIIKRMTAQIIAANTSYDHPHSDLPLLPKLTSINRELEDYFKKSKTLSESKLDLMPAFDFILYIFQFGPHSIHYRLMSPPFGEFYASLTSFKYVLKEHIKDCANRKPNFLDEVNQLLTAGKETPEFETFFTSLYESPVQNGPRRAKSRHVSSP